MEPYFDHSIPTEVVTKRNIRILIALISFWAFGAVIPIIFWPRSYVELVQLEHKVFPENETYKFDRFLYSNEVYAYIEKVAEFYEHKAKLITLEPPTYEGRDIKVLRLSLPKFFKEKPKRGRILIAGGMYGCLWDSVSAAIDLTHKLLCECKYKVPYMNEYDWYIIPIINPDGYDYTLSMIDTDVQKSANPNNRNPLNITDNHKKCPGVFLDRNFGFHWGESKSSDYTGYCWAGYAGPYAFSENETIAITNFIEVLDLKTEPVTMYIQLHGSLNRDEITFPWKFTSLPTSNKIALERMAKAAVDEVAAVTGITFTYIQGGTRRLGSGAFIDWLMGVMDVLYNFCVEATFEIGLNSTDVPDQQIYIEKVMTIVFALTNELRAVQSSTDSVIFHQTYLLICSLVLIITYCL